MTITDAHVCGALGAFVSGAQPLLASLDRVGGRLDADAPAEEGRLARLLEVSRRATGSLTVPGTAAWSEAAPAQRCAWWANRIGEVVAIPVAAPQTLGSLADRIPVRAVVTLAGRGLVVCAVAREHGGVSEERQVALLAREILGRDIAPTGTTWERTSSPVESGLLPTIRNAASLGWRLRSAIGELGSHLEQIQPTRRSGISDRLLAVAIVREVKSQRAQLRATADHALHTIGQGALLARHEGGLPSDAGSVATFDDPRLGGAVRTPTR